MKSKWIERGVLALLCMMTAANAALMAYGRARKSVDGRTVISIERSVEPAGARQLLEGLSANGQTVTVNGSPVWAVRYLSNKCGYCESDEHGKRLAEQLRRSGIKVITLVPRAGEEIADEPRAEQVTFVPMEWMRRFRLSVTPTFLVFDAGGSLLWQHEGKLAAGDAADALDIVYGRVSMRGE